MENYTEAAYWIDRRETFAYNEFFDTELPGGWTSPS
jgi:hypothetical protein